MNMRQIPVIVALVLGQAVGYSQVTMVFNGGSDRGGKDLTTANNQPVPIGNYVEIGFFNPGTDFSGNAALGTQGLINLWSAWHQFGQAAQIDSGFPPGSSPNGGSFAGQTTVSDSTFNGKQIVLWVFKTAANDAPNTSTFANVQEYGLYTATVDGTPNGAPNANWVFPSFSSGGTPQTGFITTGEINLSYIGSVGATTIGTFAAVPEPGSLSILALGFGLVAFVNRGRR